MPSITDHAPGSFCWFELATTDHEAAKQFYSRMFGWEAADFPMGPTEIYTIFRQNGRDAAAVYTMRPEQRAGGMPPNWMPYVRVESADDAAKRADALGGRTHMAPFDVAENGRMAVVADPTGAIFSVWQPKSHPGTGVVQEPGTCVWADLSTTDPSAAARFYADLCGWKMVEGKSEQPARPGQYMHIMNGREMIGGIPPAESHDPNTPPHWLLYFSVKDCGASIAQVKSLGGRLLFGPTDIEGRRTFAVVSDPQGAAFGIVT